MKNAKHILSAVAGMLVLLCLAATTVTTYRGAFSGTFTGNGAGLTNIPAAGLGGGTYTGTFVGNGASLTNVPVTALQGSLTWLTNTVVSGVTTNGDGNITVTTTNLVYIGIRP